MKKKYEVITLIVIIVIGLSWVGIQIFKIMNKQAKETAYHSDMMFMNASIKEILQKHYNEYGSYPVDVNQFRDVVLISYYGNKSKIPQHPPLLKLLEKFKYSSDGQSYEVSFELYRGIGLFFHRSIAVKGQLGETLTYVDGQLIDGNDIVREDANAEINR